MRQAVLIFCALLMLAGCRRPPEPEPDRGLVLPPPPSESHPDLDTDNLLNVAYGASVIERTGEQTLEHSAVHAIDGIASTAWISPPGGSAQSMTFALATESRIDRLGATFGRDPARMPGEIHFELSTDGDHWREVLTLKADPSGTETQLEDIIPSRATHVRVRTAGDQYWAMIRSVHAVGRELEPIQLRDPAGCWTVNGQPASITQEGVTVRGTFSGKRPMAIDGGIDGAIVRLTWLRGPAWGYAIMTLAPGGETFSALSFHEDAVVEHTGAAWFGRKSSGCPAEESASAAEAIFERTRRWSMFGLRFEDDRLDLEPSTPALSTLASIIAARPAASFAVVAHEYRAADAARNRQRATARMEQLRDALQRQGVDLSKITFEVAGSERHIAPVTTMPQRLLASRIDLELR